MKTTLFHKILSVSVFVFLSVLFSCIDEREISYTYKTYQPVFVSLNEMRTSLETQSPQILQKLGKIYAKDQYVFVNEVKKGIHIINNSNPKSPQNIAFINIPGNIDMAVRDNILYADSYIDLVALDISNPKEVKLLKRIENVFSNIYGITDEGIITDYVETWVTEKVKNGGISPQFFGARADALAFSGASATSKPGVGGSMARFTIYDNFLYAVTQNEMQLFNISTGNDPQKANKIQLGWGIETIFPYKDKLFIGTQTGMQIYDNANPANPKHLSTFAHVRSCDPVVVERDYAYVTLRSNNRCTGFANQLDVIDIKDLSKPTLIKTYPMQNPHGLGIDKSVLFLCEGEFGLKVFDAKNPNEIAANQLAHFKDKHAFDVIPLGNILLVIGEDGLYQYDYSNPKNLKLLSVIPVAP